MSQPSSETGTASPSCGRSSLLSTGLLLLMRVGGMASQFLIRLLLAHWLGARHFGEYVYVISWVSLLVMVAKLGVDTATVRYVASYLQTADWPRLKGFFQRSLLFVTVGAAAVVALLLALAQGGMAGNSPSLMETFIYGSAVVFAVTLAEQRAASLAGLHKVVLAQSALTVWRPMLFLLAIAGLYFGGSEQGTAPQAMAIMGAVACVVFVLTEFFFQRGLPSQLSGAAPVYETRTWLTVSLTLVGVSFSGQLMARTDTIMLGLLFDTTQAGIYDVASEIAKLVGLGMVAINALLAPQVSAAFAAGEQAQLQKIVTRSARLATLIALPAVVALVLLGASILGWFGTEYVAGRWSLIILCFGQLGHALAGPTGLLMAMTGHERSAFRIISCAALANIVLNAVLIPIWGMAGAAIATAIVILVWNMVVGVFCIRVLKINPTPWPGRIPK